MRYLAGLLALVAFPALADVYNVSLTMPAVSGAAQCKPYLNNVAIAGGNKACGQTIAYPALLPSEGTYTFTYSGVSASGLEGGRSPVLSVTVSKAPSTPTTPPSVTVQCRDTAGASVVCPASITVTSTP